jgi:hypothetical protein
MMKRPALTTLCLALFFAAAASAETQGQQKNGSSASDLRLRYAPQVSAGPAAPQPAPNASLFQGARPGLGISRQTYSEQDGSVAVRSGLIGTVPLAEGVSAGLGLFSVTHEEQKPPEFRRSWTPKTVGPRDRRVAALGLNVRF